MPDQVDKNMKKVAKLIKSGTVANIKKADKYFNRIMDTLQKRNTNKNTKKNTMKTGGGKRCSYRKSRKN